MSMSQAKRRYPIGAELIGENQTHFRVWAPKARAVDVVLEDAAEAKTKILFTDSRARRIFFRRSQRGSRCSLPFSGRRRREFLSRSGIAFST